MLPIEHFIDLGAICAKFNFEATMSQLSAGFLGTLLFFAETLLFSLPLGLLVAFGRMSKNGILRNFIKFYISIMRGTPLLLQLMVVFFGPSYLFKGLSFDRDTAVAIAFILNYAAYFAEIFRGGIESMPRGQYEAAEILGFSKSQTFMRIILPQVVKRILPATTNEIITLVKDTSLAQVITTTEMFSASKALSARQSSIGPLIAAGVFYYVLNYVIAIIMERVEKGLNYYR